MTDITSADRSPELLALEAKYRRLREERHGDVAEPGNSGLAVKEFVELSTQVATSYQPSSYLKSAPIRR